MDERYPAGKQVDVFYDPDRPKRAFVERDNPMPKVLLPVIFGATGLVALGGLVLTVVALINAF